MFNSATVDAGTPRRVLQSRITRRERLALAAVTALVFTTTGFLTADAADTGSLFTPVSPQRVLDTRTDAGLAGQFTSDQPRNLDITGNIPVVLTGNSIGSATVVPDGATGIVANITAVSPTTIGYIAVRPATATGEPTTSNINFTTAGAIAPNSVTVELPVGGAADIVGHIQLWFHGTDPAATTHLLVDIVGYYTTGLAGGGAPGPQGPAGPAGPAGEPATGHTLWTVDSNGAVGFDAAVVIGTNGNPIISYYDNSNDDLKVAACDNPTCTTATYTAVDTAGNVGYSTSIAVGANGNPIISYHDSSNSDLKVAACNNPTCTGSATLTAVDNGGIYTSIIIGANGNPIISYYDVFPNSDLKVAACNDPACTGPATITTLDSTGNVGLYTSISLGTNGYPVISYYDGTAGDLKIAACNNPSCTTATITALDTGGDVGAFSSIAVGTNGNPIISYYDNSNVDVKVAACNNPACTTATISTLVTTGLIGTHTSITVGANGNSIISYQDAGGPNLRVATCNNPTCTTATISSIDLTSNTGGTSSITVGTNGNPVISYYSANGVDLKMATCGNPTCTNYPARNR